MQKAIMANIADNAATADCAANCGPCSIARKNRIGPTTTGKPDSQPATLGPQRLPANEISSKKPGISSSLRISTRVSPSVRDGHGSIAARTLLQMRAIFVYKIFGLISGYALLMRDSQSR